MKKQLLALSLVATSGLFAQTSTDTSSCQEQGDCCPPCCVPKPKKCIDCECYTPKYYDLQCDCGFFLEADFLYWYSKESNLSYGLEVVGLVPTATPNPSTAVIAVADSYKDLDCAWDPGVRIGVGMNSECDGWDYYFSWTWLHGCKSQTTNGSADPAEATPSVAGETLILNPWVETAVFGTPFFDKVKAKWDLHINILDLEIGRRYWLSRCFTMRPFLGLRGAWTDTDFELASSMAFPTIEILTDQVESSSDKYNNDTWGVGIVGGFQPSWYFTPCFSLFGNVAVSALWGDHCSTKKTSVTVDGLLGTTDIEVSLSGANKSNRDTCKMQSIIDLAIGIRWEDTWCCDRYRTALDIGWEHHMWINHGSYSRTIGQGGGPIDVTAQNQRVYPLSYVSNVTDLGYGGLVIRARFDF